MWMIGQYKWRVKNKTKFLSKFSHYKCFEKCRFRCQLHPHLIPPVFSFACSSLFFLDLLLLYLGVIYFLWRHSKMRLDTRDQHVVGSADLQIGWVSPDGQKMNLKIDVPSVNLNPIKLCTCGRVDEIAVQCLRFAQIVVHCKLQEPFLT